MQKQEVKVKKLAHFHGELPRYETSGASGMDVRSCLAEPVLLKVGQRVLVPTGLALEIPVGFEIQVRPRSGLASKLGITVVNSPGTIDADYRGELHIALINLGQEDRLIKDQERVAQIVLAPVVQLLWVETAELGSSDRGAGGFGSTGTA
jgi:dUTP pyrophosphatase